MLTINRISALVERLIIWRSQVQALDGPPLKIKHLRILT